jgi:hypothetical protein
MRTALAGAVGALAWSVAAAQTVPEGIHRPGSDHEQMCGLEGRDALDLMEKARKSRELHRVDIQSPRFELFETAKPKYQLVITRPSEPAHPAVSCRHVYEEDGATQMERSMRCDASRAACDALFLEFQALDEQMKRALQSK